MSNYNKVNDFAAKDAINAPVVGTEFQQEFDAIQTAVNSKADSDDALLTGVPIAPTPDGGTTNQIVNVEYVTSGTAPIDAQSLRSRNQVTAKTGNASTNNTNEAGYVFSGDNDSGLFNTQDGQVSLAVNGVDRVRVESAQTTVINPLVTQSGLVVSTGQVTLQGTGRVTGVDIVSASTDAANKEYVDGRINNFAFADLPGFRHGTVNINGNSNKTVDLGSNVITALAQQNSLDDFDSGGIGVTWSGSVLTVRNSYGNALNIVYWAWVN